MGIDGIGKPGPSSSPVPIGVTSVGAPSGATGPFSLSKAESIRPADDSLIGRFTRGEIHLNEYLDARVEAATSHLVALAAEDREFIRATLRTELERDPALVELVRRVAGASPGEAER